MINTVFMFIITYLSRRKNMKPTKNQIFCIGCKHKKMLFESKAKADNFIKFNSEEIESQSGKAPSRSYYCSFCAGWHVTSISEEGKGVARDKRDEELWKKIKENNTSEKKKGIEKDQAINVSFEKEEKEIKIRNKFPGDEKGFILKTIALKIDRILYDIKAALCNVDISRLCYRFEELKELESEAKSKSEEFGLEVRALTKRFDKIEAAKIQFLYIYDFIVDEEKRKLHLESISEEEKLKEENIIINNIEIIKIINKNLNEMDIEERSIELRSQYKESCEKILNELIPQLKGSTKSIKTLMRHKILQILSHL